MFIQNLFGDSRQAIVSLYKNIPPKKMENGSRARNDHSEARLKPSRKTLPVTYVQHHTWALRGVRGHASMVLLLAVHTASLLGWCHLLHEACIRRFMFQHLNILRIPLQFKTSSPQLHILPSRAACRIPTLLHTAWPPRSSFEIWMKSSWNSCRLHKVQT